MIEAMTRRQLLHTAAILRAPSEPGLEIPLHRLLDKNAKCSPAQIKAFFSKVWDEAIRNFAQGSITFRIAGSSGEVLKHPSGQPRFKNLQHGIINVVLTDRVPLDWDKGRSLPGISTLYEGFCVCVISLDEAHPNQIPFFAVNTVLHELLHILLQDIFVPRPDVIHSQAREARVDLYATRLWLFSDGAAILKSARPCLQRLPQTEPRR
jgi:hypothetical protein